LLNLSENYHKAQREFNSLGIEASRIKLNLSKMMSNKNKSVLTLTKGVEYLFKKNKITYLKGNGSISSQNIVTVVDEFKKKSNYQTKNIVISTGSIPASLPEIKIDEKIIVSSTGALSFNKVPKELIIIGGGYIGLEMGSVWKRLGSNVTVVEFLDHIIPGMDSDISTEFLKILKKQGINFKLNSKVTAVSTVKDQAVVDFTNNESAKRERIQTDKVLIAVGRKPNIEGLNLTKIGIKKDTQGRIQVNKKFQTKFENIYAIGDVIPGPMLAHKAEDEGIAVAEIIAGQAGHVNYDVIPAVIYTSPEVAAVGKTEEQLKKEKIKYKVGKFPFLANSRARVNNETEGFVKIIADEKSDKVLGAHMIGPHVGTMIAEVALAMEFGASSEDIARTCHAHPTYTEAIKEAALAVDNRPIHY
jgi:dihydrolipoamide dehydrogenase